MRLVLEVWLREAVMRGLKRESRGYLWRPKLAPNTSALLAAGNNASGKTESLAIDLDAKSPRRTVTQKTCQTDAIHRKVYAQLRPQNGAPKSDAAASGLDPRGRGFAPKPVAHASFRSRRGHDVDLSGNQNFHGAFVLNRRVDLRRRHRLDGARRVIAEK